MLSTNTDFDTKHDLDFKTPIYTIHFDGEVTDYCNHKPTYPSTSSNEQDFTTYEETDVGADRVSVASSVITITDLDRDEDVYVSRDFGSDYFGDFTHYIDVKVTSITNSEFTSFVCWALANSHDDIEDIDGAGGDALFMFAERLTADTHWAFEIYSMNAGSYTNLGTSSGIAVGTEMYVTISRVGSNLSCEIYSDSSRDTLVETIGGACITTTFSHLYGMGCYNSGAVSGRAISGTVSNLSMGNSFKQYLESISGLTHRITPEEGTSSVGSVKVKILDYDDEITALLSTDANYFHRKKTIIKAGYLGMNEDDLITIMTGWVTGIELTSDLLYYEFTITDPQKWMQRKIFRGSEDSAVTVQGNPINILLGLMTSSGTSDNGDYDWYNSSMGLGIDTDYINVTEIEKVRDDWYPGDSHYMKFTVNKREKAKDFFVKQIFKPLNIYPTTDGEGRFSIKPYKPPLKALEEVQSFTEDNIIDLPRWSMNLSALVNEVEISHDYDLATGEYDIQNFYIDASSVNDRGPGKKSIEIKSKGIHASTDNSIPDRTDILDRRKNAILNRFSPPPLKITFSSFFDRWLTEIGDIVPFTHSKLPDVEAGTRGLTEERMEVINKSVDWKKGVTKFELLNTGFDKENYMVISPVVDIVEVTNTTNFGISTTDAAKIIDLTNPLVDIFNPTMMVQASHVTIKSVASSGSISCTAFSGGEIGQKVVFATGTTISDEQLKFGYIAPNLTVETATNATSFSISGDDAESFTTGDKIEFHDANMRSKTSGSTPSGVTIAGKGGGGSGTSIRLGMGIGDLASGWIGALRTKGLISP